MKVNIVKSEIVINLKWLMVENIILERAEIYGLKESVSLDINQCRHKTSWSRTHNSKKIISYCSGKYFFHKPQKNKNSYLN